MSAEQSELATKADIAGLKTELATVNGKIDSAKTDLEQKIEKVYLSQVQADSRLEQKMDKMMGKMDKMYGELMSAFEKTVVKGEKYDRKADTHADMLTAHTDKLSDHEHRIALLETRK